MTASTASVGEWVKQPLGKVARIALAGFGLSTATLSLLLAIAIRDGALLVLLGLALAATSARAAVIPSVPRLAVMAVNLISIVVVAPALM